MKKAMNIITELIFLVRMILNGDFGLCMKMTASDGIYQMKKLKILRSKLQSIV